jgi:SSS family solute:Na+ symporter
VPLAAGGLALAAVFSAELSAADAVLFMLSTSGARDLYKTFIHPRASDGQVLRAARVAAILGGAVAYALTFVFGTVLGALKFFYAILVVSLFVPILGGLYFSRGGPRAATASIAAGLAVLVIATIATRGAGIAWVSPTLMGIVGSGAAYLAAVALSPQDSRPSA